MKAKVSIIVALYNKEKYIKKSVDSLLKQTLKDIEIIIVNDCSTDKSLEIIKSIKDKRLVIINNKKNMGIGYTRNNGLKHAHGKYISFVDGDDYIEPTMIEEYYNFMEDNNLDMLNSNYNKIFSDHNELFKVPDFKIGNIKTNHNLINLINYGPCNKLYKLDLIKKNNIKFSEELKFEDFVFVAAYIAIAKKIGYLDKYLYNYMIYASSETNTVDERTFDIFNILDEVNYYYQDIKGSEELVYLNIVEITRYMLKQKYQINKNRKTEFIDKGYAYLDNINPNWRTNKYYLNEPLAKRIIKNNKTFMKFYCRIK